ncbi:17727_t:CDS:2 [Funneliformis caledonium]|uniref:17727_t:CDS:1 n=1 Tax=Funneliformis caledonium TaxID=1117310 RepID=A0A9N9DXB0_9GLOM|nr:17727_t:CDS:2 [Funneliformis caledonium]
MTDEIDNQNELPQQSQHSCSVREEEISKVTTVSQPDAESESHFASDPVIDQLINEATSDNINIKSMEKRETDAFLDEVTKDKKSQSHKKKEAENVIQDVFDFTATSAPEKNHMTEISMTENSLPVTENTNEKNSIVILSVVKSKPLLNLACLYQKACDAEKQRIKVNQ